MTTCEVCSKAKITALSFGKKSHRSGQLLDIIHVDVCGPMRNESKGKARYFLTLTDDYSRWTEVRFLRKKSKVLQFFKKFKALVEKQTGQTIKCLQSDNGRKFCNEEFDRFLKEEEIARKFTTPYTPQLNGVAERKNRTFMKMARCMLTQSKLPISFWAEGVATANFVRNRCITKILTDKTPYELWYGKRPNVKHIRIFGEVAYMLDKTPGKGKLEPRGIRCIFLGYDESSRGYREWVPSKQRVTTTQDIKFVDTDITMESPKESTPSSPNQDQDSTHSPGVYYYQIFSNLTQIVIAMRNLGMNLRETTLRQKNETLSPKQPKELRVGLEKFLQENQVAHRSCTNFYKKKTILPDQAGRRSTKLLMMRNRLSRTVWKRI